MKQRIVVTGASGFVGRAALMELAGRDVEVHAVSHTNDFPMRNVLWHKADLLQAQARENLLQKIRPTHILHFAWIATPSVYWTSPLNEGWEEATLHLLQLSEDIGAERFVGAGTCAEYDWSGGSMEEEKTPLLPTTPYGKAKAKCGIAVANHGGSTSTAWGRIFHLYGPYENPTRFVPSVILSLLRGETAKCTKGDQVRDFLHVSDVASAFVALLFSTTKGPVNIGSGHRTTLRNVAEQIAKTLGRADLLSLGALPTSPTDPPLLLPHCRKIFQECSWKPRLSLTEGLQDTISWWQRIGSVL